MNRSRISLLSLTLVAVMAWSSVALADAASHRTDDGKLKVLYHIDGADLGTAKYAMALINKHIEAEGGPDKIDLVVVVHGPALKLFDKADLDPGLKAGLKKILDMGARPEMCQVSMKIFKKSLDQLADGFQPTAHPVAVKRIADLQAEGYIYIKP